MSATVEDVVRELRAHLNPLTGHALDAATFALVLDLIEAMQVERDAWVAWTESMHLDEFDYDYARRLAIAANKARVNLTAICERILK